MFYHVDLLSGSLGPLLQATQTQDVDGLGDHGAPPTTG